MFVRALLLVIGLAGGVWSAVSLPALWSAAPAKDAIGRIIVDDRFRPGGLYELVAAIEAGPKPLMEHRDLVRAKALIRLRIAEDAMGRKSSEEANRVTEIANANIISSLAFNPTDSFLWLILYFVATARNGYDASCFAYLRESYATGPLEGWIALRRNRYGLATFPDLNETIQEKVISEFAGMVDSHFTEAAALNLMGIGWQHKDRLLASLANVDIVPREAFAKRLTRDGMKVAVPGVQIDERSWRQ